MKYKLELTVLLLIGISLSNAKENLDEENNSFRWNFENNIRLINGHDALNNQAPYQASLYDESVNSEGPFCGGAILDRTTILTGAHCALRLILIFKIIFLLIKPIFL